MHIVKKFLYLFQTQTNKRRKQMDNLQVTSIKYFRTYQGLAYRCTTNIPGVTIENDGNGGGTYLEPYSNKYTEYQLEELINQFEGVTQ